ncbi:nuclease-related domain-containing protein [Kitasatospora sp. NPDC057904]|uniref:nuclease-related domain-containing protein n=1 Tax=Kitasatospora sp. NPDC057904 TaxID=3346275 RepID=UPI0036D8B3B8
MTTNSHPSTRANVPGASARHQAAQLRAGKATWETATHAQPAESPGSRRPTAKQSAGWAVIAALAGLYVSALMALVAAIVVFVVVLSMPIGQPAQSKPKLPRTEKRRWAAPTEKDLREADNYELGAEGEEATGRILSALEDEGWTILHDRRIRDSSANLDHIAIGPRGQVVLIDSKKWRPVAGAVVRPTADEQQLLYNGVDRSKIAVVPVLKEASRVEPDMLVRPSVLVVVHGVVFWGLRLRCRGVLVVHPDALLDAVRSMPRVTDRQHMAGYLDREFPPYLD